MRLFREMYKENVMDKNLYLLLAKCCMCIMVKNMEYIF